MMKITGRVACCVSLLFVLNSVSAVKKLNSISELKRIDFGRSVPAHTLVLLHWFAHTIYIDDNNQIQLTFDPRNGDYGSHYFHNYEALLDSPPQGQHYYIVGNVDQRTTVQLPSHVVNPPALLEGGNRDRIIIRVRGQRIDQVYITQHSHNQGTPWYDPNHTYQISRDLLRQIREFAMRGNQQTLISLRNRFGSNADVSTIRNTWGTLACLGLFLCIVMKGQVYFQEQSRRPESSNSHVSTGNRVSGIKPTSESRNNNQCLCDCLLIVFIIAALFMFFLSYRGQRVF
ncbi:uncharacterized protein LOC132995457 [Labrus mixtus]|uniref:uncharacterized protein LOC132995457 n=1 Tax=Labrus mixtus TaxID=508554 RepID=UPI0029C0F858|nr:uncharacterized protein LOC132995457 [Labrus mixtus]